MNRPSWLYQVLIPCTISSVSEMGQDGNITKFYPAVEMGQAINIDEWYQAGDMGGGSNIDKRNLVEGHGPSWSYL